METGLAAIPDLASYLEDLADDLAVLRQNRLLDEREFLDFAQKRGTPVSTVRAADAPESVRRGWLCFDGHRGTSLLFHPFRIYPFYQALRMCAIQLESLALLRREAIVPAVESWVMRLPSEDVIGYAAQQRNRIVDLAILLEPLHWPDITGVISRSEIHEVDHTSRLDRYRARIGALLKRLDPGAWEAAHESLRQDACTLDDNEELYLLLRLSGWEQRNKLTGAVSGALWFRQIAEVIRRGFEGAHGVEWEEEDRAFGTWFPGGRTVFLGSERPLDDETGSR